MTHAEDAVRAAVEDHSTSTRLVRLEVKLDQLLDDSRTRGSDHEARIRFLERSLWLATGFAAAVGGVAGAVVRTVGA